MTTTQNLKTFANLECLNAIEKYIPELLVCKNENDKWEWSFRCCSSSDEGNNGFLSATEAVIHFLSTTLNLIDQESGLNDDDDE